MKLDQLSILTNYHWVLLNDLTEIKTVFIFRPDKQLLFSENGIVKKGKWEYIGNQSILIEKENLSYLLKHEFIDTDILALKIDGIKGHAIFINESKFGNEINCLSDVINFLNKKYYSKKTTKSELSNDIPNDNVITIPKYNESEIIEEYDFINGKHFKINILFNDGVSGKIFKGGKSNKFFLQYGFNGIIYFENKEACIEYLYKWKLKK